MAQPATTEARNLANYSYLTLLILGAIIALGGLLDIVGGLYKVEPAPRIRGVIMLALGEFGVFTALTVWMPKMVDAIDQERYAEAYQVASNPVQLIIGLICGVIPGILLYLTQQKLASIVGTTTPPPSVSIYDSLTSIWSKINENPTAVFILRIINFVGAVLIALNGLLVIGIWGLFIGIMILAGALMINYSEDKSMVTTGSIIVLVFSIISLFTGGGFLIGFLLCLVGSIYGLKWKPPFPEAPPPLAGEPVPAKLICKYCGAENPFYLIYCKNCGSKIGGVGEPESAGTQVKEPEKTETQVKETDIEKELTILNERLAKLEELYGKGVIEEEAYKRLKEEYETKKRELEETGLVNRHEHSG